MKNRVDSVWLKWQKTAKVNHLTRQTGARFITPIVDDKSGKSLADIWGIKPAYISVRIRRKIVAE